MDLFIYHLPWGFGVARFDKQGMREPSIVERASELAPLFLYNVR